METLAGALTALLLLCLYIMSNQYKIRRQQVKYLNDEISDLKKEVISLEANIRQVILLPDSYRSIQIVELYKFIHEREKAIYKGSRNMHSKALIDQLNHNQDATNTPTTPKAKT